MSGISGSLLTHEGGCHCGAVRFEVDAPADVAVLDCNCSICRMSGYLHLQVPKSRFRLLRGEDALVTYTFNTGTAQHYFCGTCGVKSFYVPRSFPEGYSVNLNCLDRSRVESVSVEKFDGVNWETAYETKRHTVRD